MLDSLNPFFFRASVIGAGCRWFTLKDALKHWGNHKEDRRATMCLMEAAKALADMHELKWEEEAPRLW